MSFKAFLTPKPLSQMDMITLTIPLFLPLIVLFLINWAKPKPPSAHLPPSPKSLPIIGHLHLITALPFRSFQHLAQKYGPIMYLQLAEVPTVVVSSPEITKEALKEHCPTFADRPKSTGMQILWYDYSDIAFSPYGGYWSQIRRICNKELLGQRSVRSFGCIRNDEVSRLIESIHAAAGQQLNLTEEIFRSNSCITCRAVFGKVYCKDRDTLTKLLREGIKMAGGFEVADLFPSWKIISRMSWSRRRLVAMRRKLDVILDWIIDEHQLRLDGESGNDETGRRKGNGESGEEDLVDVLLRVKGNGELLFPIGNDNIKAIIFDMFSGGTETTSTMIDWTMTELLRNPRVMSKVQVEVRQVFKERESIVEEEVSKLHYLKFVIMESLRLHPPAPLIPRASREEHNIDGYTIPAKSRIMFNIWAMHRDPKYWTNSDMFEPERFENNGLEFIGTYFHYLPFGAGKRMCPGIKFALASAEVFLARLLYCFNWRLPDGVRPEELDMIENPGITCSRKENLFVVATPYNSP